LSDRLKSLRQQVDTATLLTKTGNTSREDEQSFAQPKAQPQLTLAPAGVDTSTSHPDAIASSGSSVQGNNNADALLDADDQTLEELLADLYTDEQWLEEVAAEVSRSKIDEHKRITALLQELGTDSPPEGRGSDFEQINVDKDEHGEDDSDSEGMKREANDVLARTMDEVEWEEGKAHTYEEEPTGSHSQPKYAGKPFGNDGVDRFNLPAVPTELQDQPPADDSREDADFEADIASRMAALKGLGSAGLKLPSAPISQVDELGLPVAPTFAPGDRPVNGIYKRYGYNGEDAKTWCTVCLEDGTVRCFGCDNDIYCARCWKEMHVGPNAGYDERGHRWEKFSRDI
jgi:hypothetical protein